uniref:Ig-like domain-containing protein n=1 Tax=Timema cristinae TaxID=61476 RepID=A0A7R9CMR0_TIMCR|nr:unnamed protein product [Timema cristinae]
MEINYDSPRGGVSVITEKGDVTTSYLLIQRANTPDSGKYTCNPSNANLKTVIVHVLNVRIKPDSSKTVVNFYNYSLLVLAKTSTSLQDFIGLARKLVLQAFPQLDTIWFHCRGEQSLLSKQLVVSGGEHGEIQSYLKFSLILRNEYGTWQKKSRSDDEEVELAWLCLVELVLVMCNAKRRLINRQIWVGEFLWGSSIVHPTGQSAMGALLKAGYDKHAELRMYVVLWVQTLVNAPILAPRYSGKPFSKNTLIQPVGILLETNQTGGGLHLSPCYHNTGPGEHPAAMQHGGQLRLQYPVGVFLFSIIVTLIGS